MAGVSTYYYIILLNYFKVAMRLIRIKAYHEVAYSTKTLADLLIAARASLEMLIPSGN